MTHHDLVVIGVGSGNMVIDDSFAGLDVAIVHAGAFGGTCLNVGCIPSKMLIQSARMAVAAAEAPAFGVRAPATPEPVLDWADARDRVFGRLDAVSAEGRRGREETPWITLYPGTARFTGPRTLDVDCTRVSADQVVIAAGGRPLVPPPIEESGLPYETSETVMRVAAAPRRLAVLGGGYIAAELAEAFSGAGSEITVVEQADTLLGAQDELVGREFTELARRRWDLRLGRAATGLEGEPGALRLRLDDGSAVEADLLLVAVGRVSNADRLDCERAGVDLTDDGRIVVDDHQRTSADGVWALGDVSTAVPLKHVANREAEVVRHNLRHPDDLRSAGDDPVPAAVFTAPQVASVGATEQRLRADGVAYRVGLARYSDSAYGWAVQDSTGFCKVLAETRPDGTVGKLLGAHIIGPQAATLIHPLVLALTLDIPAQVLLDRPYWIHPAPTEVVKDALLALRRT